MSIIDCDRDSRGRLEASIQRVENSAYTLFWLNASLSRYIAESVSNNSAMLERDVHLSGEQISLFMNAQCMNSIVNLWLHCEAFVNYLLVRVDRSAIAESRLPTLDKWILFSEFEMQDAGRLVKGSNEYAAIRFLKLLRNDIVHNRHKAYEYYVEATDSKQLIISDSRDFKDYNFPRNPMDLGPNHICCCFEIVEALYQLVIKTTRSSILKDEYESRFIYGKVPLFSGAHYAQLLTKAIGETRGLDT